MKHRIKATGYLAFNYAGQESGITMCAFEELIIKRDCIILTPFDSTKDSGVNRQTFEFKTAELIDIKIVELEHHQSIHIKTPKARGVSSGT